MKVLPTCAAQLSTVILFAAALALPSCGRYNPPPVAATNEVLLRRGLSAEPSALDPAMANDAFSTQVMTDLYEGLTTESETGEAIPGVASSWTVSDSGRTYTFYLRPQARWSNGEPVRASDFINAWRRNVDPKFASPNADNFRIIQGAAAIISGRSMPDSLGVFAPTDNVLVVHLAVPTAYLPQFLTHAAAFPIYSEESARSHDSENWVSNGAYTLASWQPGTAIQLKKNLRYWDASHVQVDRVEYQFASDAAAQYARYRAGQLDLTDNVPANAIMWFRQAHSTELLITPFLGTAYYGLNLTMKPLAGDLKLRQALTLSIDRQRLVSTLGFGQTPAYSFLPPGTWNYHQQAPEWASLSQEERAATARRLYLEAGYTRASPLHLRLLYNSNPIIQQTAIVVAAMWKEVLGVETELREEEYRVFLQSRHDKNRWEILRLGWTADFNDASNFLNIFRSNSTNNDEGYMNPKVDALLDQAAVTSEPTERRGRLEAVERLILADYPIVPLYYFVSKRLIKPYVKGVLPSPLNQVPSKNVSVLAH